MSNFVMLGEILLRLKAPGYERLLTGNRLEASFGGAELNVAVCLSRLGEKTSIISAIPDNNVGDAALAEINRWGVGTANIKRVANSRLGIYFLEAGSNMRPGQVTYDRANSAMAEAAPTEFEWGTLLESATYLHTSGSTVPLSESSIRLVTEALTEAQSKGTTTSFDFNVRTLLWERLGLNAADYMDAIVQQSNILFASSGDCKTYLGLSFEEGNTSVETYKGATARMFEIYPNLKVMASTFRESQSADNQKQYACMRTRDGFYVSRTYDILNIVDRIGTGDAFAAGVLYGHNNFADDPQRVLNYGITSSAIKHTIPGDFNLTSAQEIEAVIASDGAGSLKR